jgi:hypothetical protein
LQALSSSSLSTTPRRGWCWPSFLSIPNPESQRMFSRRL